MANFFHDTVKLAPYVSIEVSSKGTHTFIGEKSVIDDFVKIKHVAGDGHVKIGNGVYINSGTVIYSGNGVTIGDNVLIGPNCNIVPANHKFSSKNQLIRDQRFAPSKGGIIIEEDVWLGANVTILDGAIIKKGCVIGANSLVKAGELEAYSIYSGNPLEKRGERK